MTPWTFKQKLFLGWAGGVIGGTILYLAGVEFGAAILSVLVAWPIVVMLVWNLLTE